MGINKPRGYDPLARAPSADQGRRRRLLTGTQGQVSESPVFHNPDIILGRSLVGIRLVQLLLSLFFQFVSFSFRGVVL